LLIKFKFKTKISSHFLLPRYVKYVTRTKIVQHSSRALFLHMRHSETAVEACGYSESVRSKLFDHV